MDNITFPRKNIISFIPDDNVCYIKDLIRHAAVTNTKSLFITDAKLDEEFDNITYINSEFTGHFNPLQYVKSEMDIVSFCTGLVKQFETPVSENIRNDETMYNKVKRTRKAIVFALSTIIICVKIFDKDAANFAKVYEMIKECENDEHILLEYVQQAEDIRNKSSVSYYWSLFMELCDNNVQKYRKIMAELRLAFICYYDDRMNEILQFDDGVIEKFVREKTGPTVLVLRVTPTDIKYARLWNAFVYMFTYSLKTATNRAFLLEKVPITLDQSWEYSMGLSHILHSEISGAPLNTYTNIIVRKISDVQHMFGQKWTFIRGSFNIQLLSKDVVPDKNTIAFLKETILKNSGAKSHIPLRIIALNDLIKSLKKATGENHHLIIHIGKDIVINSKVI